MTHPLSGFSKPAMMSSKVDLPQPLGPTMTMNSPSATSRETSSSACTVCRFCWNHFETCSTTSLAGGGPCSSSCSDIRDFRSSAPDQEHPAEIQPPSHSPRTSRAPRGESHWSEQFASTHVQSIQLPSSLSSPRPVLRSLVSALPLVSSRSNPSAPDALPRISSPSPDLRREILRSKPKRWSVNPSLPPAPCRLLPSPNARP